MKFITAFVEALLGLGICAFLISAILTAHIEISDVGNSFGLYFLISMSLECGLALGVVLLCDAYRRGNK